MTIMTFTSVPVKPQTLARLKAYKSGGASYDEVINELLDASPPDSFLREHLRRLREEPRISWASVRRKRRL